MSSTVLGTIEVIDGLAIGPALDPLPADHGQNLVGAAGIGASSNVKISRLLFVLAHCT